MSRAVQKIKVPPKEVRQAMQEFEGKLGELPHAKHGDDIAPLEHTFTDKAYIRQITMPKGMYLTSKIHKTEHPYFVMKGRCSVITDDKIVEIRAPHWGVTKPWTKRVLYIHGETAWITVHPTELKDLKKIEDKIIAKSFQERIEQREEKCLGE